MEAHLSDHALSSQNQVLLRKELQSPGWCGSVDWVLA